MLTLECRLSETAASRWLHALVGRDGAQFGSGTLSISSARTEMEFVPAVSLRIAPPLATTVPVLMLYSA